MNRIDRLSAILNLLQSSTVVKPRQIADRFDISIRTVYRDLKSLEETGVPIAGDSRTGYSLVEGYKLPPLMFSQEEAFAFLAAERLVDRFTDSGLKESYQSGIDKIKAVMRLAEKTTIEDFDNKVTTLNFQHTGDSDSHNSLQILMDATAKRKKVRITYFSYHKQAISERLVDPIGIFFSMSSWYFIAFCNEKEDYRTFRVSRIREIILTEEGFSLKHPSLDSFLKTLKDKDNLQKVILKVAKLDFPLIDESKYYQGLVEENETGNYIEMHFMTFSLERFSRWYLSFIDITEVLHPTELKTKVNSILLKSKV
jgi:predicted DNA-binding transcriptional regulator YafY